MPCSTWRLVSVAAVSDPSVRAVVHDVLLLALASLLMAVTVLVAVTAPLPHH
jgi:hypothetical protein